jgi:hypothetical protein
MAQIKSPYELARIPFAKMSFTPDVPTAALGPNEYNAGKNVETDIRSIRSMAGDLAIFDDLPFTPVYVTGGFRRGGEFWFIVAVEGGYWYASNGKKYQYTPLPAPEEMWYDITPPGTPIGYGQNINITEAWNGTVPVFNDTQTPPFFWPDELDTVSVPTAKMIMYSNQVPIDIANITALNVNEKLVTFKTAQANPPFNPGDLVVLTEIIPSTYNGTWVVDSCTANDVTILHDIDAAYGTGGVVSPQFSWNYNPRWATLTAQWLRMYNTPNVGSILVAGNLTAFDTSAGSTVKFPVTVRWSQNFGLNEMPITWTPTVTNIANELEVPLRGETIDAFPCNGQFFLCSYWDTVVFSPINYATTATPILGVRQFNQGRGLLSSNCWANTDKLVYGVDARDIWVFDGQSFQGLGNQRVKNWFYDQLDPEYYDRVFMEVNTQRNQVEIYYPDSNAVNGVPNKMLSYRYDLDCWNAPRDVSSATMACESPIWKYDALTGEYTAERSTRTVVYANVNAATPTECKLVEKDIGYEFLNNTPIESVFRRDNAQIAGSYSTKAMVHRILPEAVNIGAEPFTATDETQITPSTGTIDITIEGANSVGSAPSVSTAITVDLDTDNPWVQINQNAFRVNSIEISNTSDTNIWSCNAVTWQFTPVEDDR